MMSEFNSSAQPLAPTDSSNWVFPISLEEPCRLLPSGLRWARRGELGAFFTGVLFERDDLLRSIGPLEYLGPNCSDAALVLSAYERFGLPFCPVFEEVLLSLFSTTNGV